MAIAPLLDTPGAGSEGAGGELPWPLPPRPGLRVVQAVPGWVADGSELAPDGGDPAGWDDAGSASVAPWGLEHAGAPRGVGAPRRAERRRPSEAVARRRRRLLLAVAAVGIVVALAAPVTLLGGRPAKVPAAAAGSAATAGSTVYVVQPGDTLWSIAVRFDAGGDPRPLAQALARQTGSATVVPGERIAIP